LRLPLLLATAALVLAGCTGGSDSPAGPASAGVQPNPTSTEKYVALGDSFTSGPLIPTTDVASGCFRSDHNYPALLAHELGITDFVDVSCSGATTGDLVGRQRTLADARVPPQLRAVKPDATLVTVGIGGNDFELFTHLTQTCTQLRASDPTGSPCRDAMEHGGRDLLGVTAEIGRNVERALERVSARAPEARVVLVGYPRIAPVSGGCPAKFPYADGDIAFGDQVQRALNDAMRRAAHRAGADFVDMYAASRGHDVCSAAPYVNGQRTLQNQAAAFHPFEREMQAVATRLAALLEH
jgi:lysophospholipase L1-like esterase